MDDVHHKRDIDLIKRVTKHAGDIVAYKIKTGFLYVEHIIVIIAHMEKIQQLPLHLQLKLEHFFGSAS